MTEKKTTTRKPRATIKKEEMKPVEAVTEPTIQVEEIETNVETVEQKRRVLRDEDLVPVMNNTTGLYGYVGRDGYSFDLEEYGDIIEIPFKALKTMNVSAKRHIHDAFIVILDEDAVEQLHLGKLYTNILDEDGLEKVLQDPNRLSNVLSKMPETMKETLIIKAKEKMANGELNNLQIVKVIKDIANYDLLD